MPAFSSSEVFVSTAPEFEIMDVPLPAVEIDRGMARRASLLKGLNIETGAGLEINALHRPTLDGSKFNVRFVDFNTTAELRQLYKDVPSVPTADIVEVDYIWSAGSKLSDIVGFKKFDYVIASHVVQRAPNPVSWLQQIEECLSNGGALSLVIPDKRYTFDFHRHTTEIGQIINAYLTDLVKPTPGQVFDHLFYHGKIDDVHALWSRELTANQVERVHTAKQAFDIARSVLMSEPSFGVHCSIVTPAAMLDILENLSILGLTRFVVENFEDTHFGEIDFFLSLRKSNLAGEELLRGQLDAIRKFKASNNNS